MATAAVAFPGGNSSWDTGSSRRVLAKVSSHAHSSRRDRMGKAARRQAEKLRAPCTRAASRRESWSWETGPTISRDWLGRVGGREPLGHSGGGPERGRARVGGSGGGSGQ